MGCSASRGVGQEGEPAASRARRPGARTAATHRPAPDWPACLCRPSNGWRHGRATADRCLSICPRCRRKILFPEDSVNHHFMNLFAAARVHATALCAATGQSPCRRRTAASREGAPAESKLESASTWKSETTRPPRHSTAAHKEAFCRFASLPIE